MSPLIAPQIRQQPGAPLKDSLNLNSVTSLTFFRRVWQRIWPSLCLLAILTGFLTAIYQYPPDYQFSPGSQKIEPYLTGFYGQEKNERFDYRWSKPNWKADLPLVGRRAYGITLSALSLKPAEVQVVNITGQEVARFTPEQELQTFRFNLPASAVPGGNLALLFKSNGFQPENSGDPRNLGLVVTEFEIKGQPGFVLPPVFALIIFGGGRIKPLFADTGLKGAGYRQLALASAFSWAATRSPDLLELISRLPDCPPL